MTQYIIPNYLPVFLPKELWEFIFHWKWQLETKDIRKEYILKIINKRSWKRYTTNKDYYPCIKSWVITGDTYAPDGPLKVIKVRPKCGIELLNYPFENQYLRPDSVFYSAINLYKHITENLGITCYKNMSWCKMMKLLRTV